MKNKVDNSPQTECLALIRNRRSVRAFLPQAISREIIGEILNTAKYAPSGVNTQPWRVMVVGDKARQQIGEQIIAAKESNVVENPDYQYYPTTWTEPYKSRRKACGMALYGALQIDKGDVERRKQQWYKNYHFFHAPVGLIFYLDKNLCKGSWMDMGMFIQSVMLAARCFNIESCAQAALAEYPDIIREVLNLSDDYHIVCGMALGYADWSQPENNYRTEREPLENFADWID